jgi:hypothetical protein
MVLAAINADEGKLIWQPLVARSCNIDAVTGTPLVGRSAPRLSRRRAAHHLHDEHRQIHRCRLRRAVRSRAHCPTDEAAINSVPRRVPRRADIENAAELNCATLKPDSPSYLTTSS